MSQDTESIRIRRILLGMLVVIVLAGTFFLGGAVEKSQHNDEHNEEVGLGVDDHSTEMAPAKYLVKDSEVAPTVLVSLKKDSKKGYNIFLTTSDFTFAPEKAGNGTSSANEGHAHIFVNGNKIGRMYGAAMYLPDLVQGDKVMVSLNTNNHEDIVDGDLVVATERTAE